jgi:serine-type D-Ala-D-Ala carboxypeptidase
LANSGVPSNYRTATHQKLDTRPGTDIGCSGMTVNSRLHALALGCALLIGCGHAQPLATPGAPDAGRALVRGIASADSLLSASVETLIPGAVLLVMKDGKVIHERAFGYAQLRDFQGSRLPSPRPMTTSTSFDLASVTKVVATTFAVMMLVDRDAMQLDAPVHNYLHDFRGPRLDSITIRQLLQHSSGLVQWQPLYYQASTAAETYDAIRRMPPGSGVGESRRYSDPGFMLLGHAVERVSGRRLDRFVEDELYRPLGLHRTAFNPEERSFDNFAATEAGNGYERRMVYDSTFGYRYMGDPESWNGWRDYVLAGEVNDGNAFHANAGVAGHAGLFSTARELGVLLELMLNRGSYGGRRYISAHVVDQFLTPDSFGHYLGWQQPAGLPQGSFAHPGFTGTYVLGVPKHRLSIVLLTNRQNMGVNERGYFPNVDPLRAAVVRAIVSGAEDDGR